MNTETKINHPNRAKPALEGTPSPAEIKAARAAAGLPIGAAGAVVLHTAEQWAAWEIGTRRMHPIIWWAFKRRLADQMTYEQWEASQRREFSPVSPEAYHAERAWNAARVMEPVATCATCKRPLNVPSDESTADCGGDCLRCMADAGDPTHVVDMRRIEPRNPKWKAT